MSGRWDISRLHQHHVSSVVALSIFILHLILFPTFSSPQSCPPQSPTTTQSEKRIVTVADAVCMTQFSDPLYIRGISSKNRVAQFSPDGQRFLLTVKKGNLATNTNKYSLLLFRTVDAFRAPAPEKLVTFSSSSNRPGIQDLKWIDSHTVAFLGEHPGEQQQLYSLNVDSREIRKLTNHDTILTAYAMNAKSDWIFFTAELPVASFLTENARKSGIRVSTQLL